MDSAERSKTAPPSFLPLNEVDYFMYAMDAAMRSGAGRGNVCALSLTLGRRVSPAELASTFPREISDWLCSLRLVRALPAFRPGWRSVDPSARLSIEKRTAGSLDELHAEVAAVDIDARKEAPIRALLHRLPEHDVLTFIWHHALCDAHGGELLVNALCDPDAAARYSYFARPASSSSRGPHPRMPLRDRLRKSRAMVRHIVHAARPPLGGVTPPAKASGVKYHEVLFSAGDTETIDRRCAELGAPMFKSSVYLAATARAFARLCDRRGESGDFHVPIPHDFRRSTAVGPVFCNNISVLFYRIPRVTLCSLPDAMDALLAQAEKIIQNELHRGCRIFLDLAKALPVRWYLKLLLRPTGGRLASFFFSDTGSSLDRFRTACGVPVTDARHIPPHFYPPGFTAVFSRRAGSLRAMLIASESVYERQDFESFEASLRADLLGSAV